MICRVRVSTEDHVTDAQVDELRAAGCQTILQGGVVPTRRAPRQLTRLMRESGIGDVTRRCKNNINQVSDASSPALHGARAQLHASSPLPACQRTEEPRVHVSYIVQTSPAGTVSFALE